MALPNITESQIAIDPINGILYYIDSSGNLINSSLNLLQTSGSLISTDDSLSILGNTTILESSVTILKDPIVTLGGNTAPSIDDNRDRGVEFRWHNGTSAKVGFFGFDDSTGKFTFIPDATNTSEVFSGSLGEIEAKIKWAHVIDKPNLISSVTGTENEVNVDYSDGNIIISLPATLAVNVNGTSSGWATARKITLAGDLEGNVFIDGGSNVTLTANVVSNSIDLGTDTSGDYVANLNAGTGITIVNGTGEQSQPIISVTNNTYDAYGAAATAEINAAAALSNHELDTTNIHGIANTAALVTLTGNQTLTNKTLTSPIITGISPTITLDGDLSGSVTLTNLSSATLNASIALTFQYVEDITAGTNIVVTDNTVGVGNNRIYSVGTSPTPNFTSVSTASLSIDGVEIDTSGANSNDQVLRFDVAANKFIPGIASTVATLADLTDVSNTAPSTGDFLYWDGTIWTPSVPATGMPIVSDSAPISPISGQLWFQSSTARTFIYYIDSSSPPSSQWVEVGTASSHPDLIVSKVTQVIGNGASNTATVTHNLNTRHVIAEIYDNTTFETVEARVVRNSLDSIEVNFSQIIPANAYTVVVIG